MSESDGPKFACPACGREFRWKPELAGKKAKCKCGTVIPVPAQEPLALEPPPAVPVPIHADSDDPFGAIDQGAYGTDDPSAAAPPPPPPSNTCPVCGTAALPTAVMCTSCGYNFRTGLKTIGFGRPVAPRDPDGGGTIAADAYQLAAKASWILPAVGILFGCCVGAMLARSSPTAGAVVGIFQLLLLLSGLGLGIFALTGIRRNGREGILAPAVVGISLSGLIVALNVVVAVMLASGADPFGVKSRGAKAVAAADAKRQASSAGGGRSGPIRTPADAERAGRESFAEGGWVGVARHGDATITLVSVSDASPLAAEMLDHLKTPVSIVVLAIDNSGGRRTFSVDPTGGQVHLKDGTSRPLPDIVQVLRTVTRDRKGAMETFAPPFQVPPRGQLTGKVVFVPPGTDPQHIDAISITVDGKSVNVQGEYVNAQQKGDLMRIGGGAEGKE